MTNDFMRRTNAVLLGTVVILGLTVIGSNNFPVFAVVTARPREWMGPSLGNPQGCSPVIDTLSSCPSGATSGWSGRYTTCATASNGQCCDYSTWTHYCTTPGTNNRYGIVTISGSIAQYEASYFNMSCTGAPYGCR